MSKDNDDDDDDGLDEDEVELAHVSSRLQVSLLSPVHQYPPLF